MSETAVKILLPILLAIKFDNLLMGGWCVGRTGIIAVSLAGREFKYTVRCRREAALAIAEYNDEKTHV